MEELLTGKESYVLPIRASCFVPRRPVSRSAFAACCGMTNPTRNGRFRAALALADFIPASEQAWWTAPDLKFVAGQLVSSNAEYQPLLREALRPIRARLVGDLEHLFADARGRPLHSDSAPPTRWPTLPGATYPGSPACSPSPPPSSSTCSTRSSRRAAHRQWSSSSARSPPLRRPRRWDRWNASNLASGAPARRSRCCASGSAKRSCRSSR